MMRAVWAISLAMLAGPIAAPASEAITPERVEAFVEVLEANGCRMSNHRADAVFPENGFGDKTESKAITEMLIAEERARILDEQLVLVGGKCGVTQDSSGRQRFFAGMADNDCVMTTKEAGVILPKVGVELQEIRLLMDRMISMGEVRFSAVEKTVYLEESLCEKFKGLSATMAASAPKEPPALGGDDLKTAFLSYTGGVGCSMTRAQSHDMLTAAGFDARDLRPVIQEMIDAGEATMTGEEDLLTLDQEVCG